MTDWFGLDGKVAVITGGASGIGHATAQRLEDAGATVVIADLAEAPGVTTCDVTDAASVERLSESVVETHGRWDILVTCAGFVGAAAPVWEVGVDEWHRVLDVNLTGVWLTNRAAIEVMRGQRSGRIVNLSSTAGKDGNAGFGAYSAAKAGVIALTKSLAKEVVDDGILMSSVAPAAVDTPLLADLPSEDVEAMRTKIPLGRLGRPEEIAALIHYLVSDDASFTTGACFDASGGRSVY